ncbi:MAG: D-2-hydroxyacid dehydrogenase [Kiritimatiellales bacterium]
MIKIAVLDGYTLNPGDNPWDELNEFGTVEIYDRTAPEEFFERAANANILLTNKTPIGREQIELLPKLKFIAVLATGYNVVDIEAAAEKGIPVANVPTYGTDSVAQHALALLLELTNHTGAADKSIRDGRWSSCPDFSYWDKSNIELRGAILGIVGFGRIGQQMARLGAALGMKIIYADAKEINLPEIPAQRVGVEELFEQADVVSLHCSQAPENFQFVNTALIAKMKLSALLINTARGTLIKEDDLAEALRNGVIAGAGLDVLSIEPPLPANPLLTAPNCILTPHVAWSSLAGRRRLMKTTLENVRGFLEGKAVNIVNGVLPDKK